METENESKMFKNSKKIVTWIFGIGGILLIIFKIYVHERTKDAGLFFREMHHKEVLKQLEEEREREIDSLWSLLSYIKEGFDAKNSTYKNSDYHIIWFLDEDGLEWFERPILSQGTIFKVRDYNKDILVTINIQQYNREDEDDIWNLFADSSYIKSYTDMVKQIHEMQGYIVLSSTINKTEILSKHAIVTRTNSIGESGYKIEYAYQFSYHGIAYTLAISSVDIAQKDIDDYDKTVERLIKKFYILI